MRFIVKKYDDGSMFAIETTDDGSEIVRSLDGNRKVGQRLSAFVEVLADDTADGISRTHEALDCIKELIAARKNP